MTAPPNNSTSDQTTVLLQWSFTNGWGNSCVGTNNQFKIYTRPSPSGNWSVPATWPAASPVPRPFPTASCSPTVGLLTVPINLTPLSVKSLSLNWGGLQEKWFVDKNKSDYYIFPLANRAKVYKWQNGLQAGSGSPKGDKLITDTETLDCYNNIRGGSLPTAYGLPFTGSVGSTYDWRVRAVNGGGGTDSNIWSFTISGTPPPLASWWQASSGDVTAKGDIQSAIPNGQYLITNPPGVAVAGGNISLNNQPASSVGWKVASSQLSSGLATDYNFTYLKSRIKTVVDPASITTPVTSLSQLTPATGLVDGVYYVYSSGNIDVTGNLDIGNNKIVWVAEGGDVNLKSKINLNDGQGVLVIMAEKNINIDPTVGTTPLVDPATLTPHLEGIFIAGGLVNTGNGNNQLRIDGSVVGLSGVSLLRQQTSAYPAEYFVFRPDLIVNLPKPLLRTNRLWQEVAP